MDVYARRRLVAVLAVVLVVVLIGVAVAGGGDDDQTPITTVAGASTPGLASPLSKSEFIEQADDICEETAVAIENLGSEDAAQLAEDELSLTENQLSQLRSLVPPEADQETLDDFFRALEDLIDSQDARVLVLERADDTAGASIDAEIAAAAEDLAEAADAYGFNECGSTGTAGETAGEADETGEPVAPPTDVAPVAPEPAPTEPAPEPAPSDSGGTGSGDSGGGGGGGGGSGDSGGLSP